MFETIWFLVVYLGTPLAFWMLGKEFDRMSAKEDVLKAEREKLQQTIKEAERMYRNEIRAGRCLMALTNKVLADVIPYAVFEVQQLQPDSVGDVTVLIVTNADWERIEPAVTEVLL